MSYTQLNELSMYFEEQGSGDAPPLILLHGAGGSADDPVGGWAALAPSFAEAFHVYLVEYRGHGRTGNPAGFMTFEQIGDDIAAFAQELGLGPAHIAGISDGGIVALDCAIRRPELTRTITVVGANYCVHEGVLNVTATLDPDALEQRAPDTAADFARRHDRGKHAGHWKDLIRQIAANNSANPTWTPKDLQRIACPTLLISGENDPYATAEQMTIMKREIPDAEWLILNNAGHPVHFELPEIVGPRILDFLGRNT